MSDYFNDDELEELFNQSEFERTYGEDWLDPVWDEVETRNELERMYDQLKEIYGLEEEQSPDIPTFRIFELATGMPKVCSCCGKDDKWTVESCDAEGNPTVLVCDHGNINEDGFAIPIRQLDSITSAEILKVERTNENAF